LTVRTKPLARRTLRVRQSATYEVVSAALLRSIGGTCSYAWMRTNGEKTPIQIPYLAAYPASAANASGFLLASLSKTPRISSLVLCTGLWPRRFRSRLAVIREQIQLQIAFPRAEVLSGSDKAILWTSHAGLRTRRQFEVAFARARDDLPARL